MNQIVFLLLLIILALGLPLIFNLSNMIEGYSNYSLDQAAGNFPDAQTKVLVQDTYPPIGKNEISNDTANDIWMDYPIFPLGSYAQITNNIRYPDNPDETSSLAGPSVVLIPSNCALVLRELWSNKQADLRATNPIKSTSLSCNMVGSGVIT